MNKSNKLPYPDANTWKLVFAAIGRRFPNDIARTITYTYKGQSVKVSADVQIWTVNDANEVIKKNIWGQICRN